MASKYPGVCPAIAVVGISGHPLVEHGPSNAFWTSERLYAHPRFGSGNSLMSAATEVSEEPERRTIPWLSDRRERNHSLGDVVQETRKWWAVQTPLPERPLR